MGNTRRGITLIDVMIVLVMVVFLTTTIAIVAANTHESADRVKRASNLKQIGLAIQLYVSTHGEWPRTRYAPESADRPTFWTAPTSTAPFSRTGPAVNDVTAAYRLLLAYEDLVPEVFRCPLSPVADNDFAQKRFVREHSNFLDERELNYSFANPYHVASVDPKAFAANLQSNGNFAVGADVNPGQSDAGGVLSAGPMSSARDTRLANSPNHDREGQNVLFGDGHVEFTQNPFVGVDRDNIDAYGKKDDAALGYGIVGSPANANDSVLLPALDPAVWQSAHLRRQAVGIAWIAVPALVTAALLICVKIAIRRQRARQLLAVA